MYQVRYEYVRVPDCTGTYCMEVGRLRDVTIRDYMLTFSSGLGK
jgi:hypothetical protein